MLLMQKPIEHYKLLLWICVTLNRANVDYRAFVELDGCWFKRMFVAFGAYLNDFTLGSRKCCL